jgi:uncharacterized protein (TIGR02099 family)
MKQFFRNLSIIVAYAFATLLIVMAVVVGLFRLFLPRLPEYQEEIKGWAGNAIGMEVEFSGMNARWALSGPELEFYDAELIRRDSQKRVLAAERVGIGISVGKLLFDRSFVVDRVLIRDTSVEIRQLEDGGFWIQGSPLEEFTEGRSDGLQRPGEFDIVGEDIVVHFLQPGDERPRDLEVRRVIVSIDENRIAIDATGRLPADLGRQVDLSATQLLGQPREERGWDIRIEGEDIDLAGWSQLQQFPARAFLSGDGDLELSLAWSGGRVTSAAGILDFRNIAAVEDEAFDVGGRFEVDVADDGWFFAVEDLRVATGEGAWPDTTVRVESSVDPNGELVVLAVDASYINLDDASLLLPWLPDDRQTQLLELNFTGVIRNLDFTVYNLGDDAPSYDIDASLADFGVAPIGKIPGVRGFTGSVSASQERGHVDIATEDMQLDLPALLDMPLEVSAAAGTITWRSDASRTLIVTDRVSFSTPFMESQADGDLTISKTGDSPRINLDMTWSIGDLALARRYVPSRIMKPKLYNWFQTALVKGSVPRGSLRLSGPLDKFPFDNDEGKFLVEGSVRGLTMKYQPQWPAAEQADVEMVLDNMRLYSVRNRSTHAGNRAVDVAIEIADLRQPVLRIDGLVTGTLATLQEFAVQSPIDRFTGGNLRRVSLSGDASFGLDLTVPLKRPRETEIVGLLRSNGGTLVVDGLGAPLTDLIGEVRITRDEITGDSLGGRFLDNAVELRIGPGDDARYFAVATATGTASAQAIVEELGVPLAGLIEGAAGYETRILFPRGGQDPQPPFTVRIASPLRGMLLNLPEPFAKSADASMLVRGDIRFMPGGERIESSGVADEGIAWQLEFSRPEGTWDLDRGVVQSGGGTIEPADTRGLHLRGRVASLRLEEWLSVSRSRDPATTAAGRIRSVDLVIDDLYAIGQHLENHHVRVDRSARDWLVQIEGEDVQGSVFVPYDFVAGRALTIDMERMHLPGNEDDGGAPSTIDPRTLPPIELKAADFALGNRRLGRVEAVLARTGEGLVSETLEAVDETFRIVGQGSWVADAAEPLGSRTTVSATLNSSDVETTLRRLDFARGISGRSMDVDFGLSWGGAPRADFLGMLDGDVRLRLENGQLEEVEPGAGRMVGLISFVALPRRLSLDFRDVFSRGFGYDKIAGTFTISDGVASTCDLSLEGPAADIGIVGQVDLAKKQYEQAAVISANVGNTLPLVGAVVGGPPGAAAMLIFSQIFKKPLQEVGQVFYGISGPWEEPAIESVSADRFVDYGRLAGCLATGEQD